MEQLWNKKRKIQIIIKQKVYNDLDFFSYP